MSAWKIPLLQSVLEGAAWSGKELDPVDAGLGARLHAREGRGRRRHAFVGSFNLSRSGERNAENVLEIRDAAFADRLAAFVDEIRGLYPPATVPPDRLGSPA